MSKYGMYAWTASSAGWFVLAYATNMLECLVVAIGCGIMAVAWHWIVSDMEKYDE